MMFIFTWFQNKMREMEETRRRMKEIHQEILREHPEFQATYEDELHYYVRTGEFWDKK